MSGNHNESLDRALAIVEAAAASGAHALKLQTYTPDTMTLDCDEPGFRIMQDGSLWKGKTLYELYREAHTPWDWHQPIFERAAELGLICFSTPFDDTAVDFLESLDVPCYKISSFEITDLPLIRTVASTGKPMIVSTGMAALAEIDEAVTTAHEAGCQNVILLKCTSTYPAEPTDTNLRTLPHMRAVFGCEVGLSDHTMGIGAAVASVALGASVIEKHFTLARADGGVDSTFSMEPREMHDLVTETERAWQALGHVRFGAGSGEIPNKMFRRSIYASQDIGDGEILTHQNIRVIRPGFGLPPRFLEACLGRAAKHLIRRGTPIDWSQLS